MNGNSMIGVTSCFVIKGKVNRQVIYLNGIVYYKENIWAASMSPRVR